VRERPVEGIGRVADALERHVRDTGFKGLRLDTVSPSGRVLSFRLLPPPLPEGNPLYRLIPAGAPGADGADRTDRVGGTNRPDRTTRVDGTDRPDGTTGRVARRLRLDAAINRIRCDLAQAAGGTAFSSTLTAGLVARFGPEGVKITFPGPEAVWPSIVPVKRDAREGSSRCPGRWARRRRPE